MNMSLVLGIFKDFYRLLKMKESGEGEMELGMVREKDVGKEGIIY